MRRPLCVFCVGTLGVELVCAFLPQTGLLLPFAAFFVPALLWLFFGKNSRGYGVCLLLGALAGLLLTAHTRQKLDRVHTAYADREVTLTAEVEEVSASYYPGVVHAVLRVEPTGGEETAFRMECVCMPKCTAGERVQARFALEVPARTQQLSSYADGIALSGEYLSGMKRLGPSESFRAKTARLQRRLSAALRKGMAQGPAGVLAAMVLGDRTHLSKDLRSAYRAAGLSHVLVVSGMHVSIPLMQKANSSPHASFSWLTVNVRRPMRSSFASRNSPPRKSSARTV